MIEILPALPPQY